MDDAQTAHSQATVKWLDVCRTAFHSAAACYQTLRGVYSTRKVPGASAAAVNVTDLNPPIVARKLGRKCLLFFSPLLLAACQCLSLSRTPPRSALGYDDVLCQPHRPQSRFETIWPKLLICHSSL